MSNKPKMEPGSVYLVLSDCNPALRWRFEFVASFEVNGKRFALALKQFDSPEGFCPVIFDEDGNSAANALDPFKWTIQRRSRAKPVWK